MQVRSVPVRLDRVGPKNTFEITFPQGMLWGIMGCTLGFAISLASERAHGTMYRLRCAPLAALHVLGGKGLACFVVAAGVSAMLLAVGVVGFGVRPTSYVKVGVALVAASGCFVGVMMLLATCTNSERGGSGLGWGVLMVLSMIGGGMIPLEFLPGWLSGVSHVSPVKWSILAIEGGLWRDLSWGQMALPVSVLSGIGAAGFGVGMAVLGSAERA
jgi:ABC-2 type transport system permease protein